MPRNVRNFWIELSADGYTKTVAIGPKSKDGNAEVTVNMRHKGCVTTPLVVEGIAQSNGKLLLRVTLNGKVFEHVTDRD